MILDIELRFVERTETEQLTMNEYLTTTRRILQMRKLNWSSGADERGRAYSEKTWTDWADVPMVQE